MEAFPALSWKKQNFYVNPLINKCPGFPGNSWQKELAKKKGLRSKEHKFAVYPPIATNMEVNLRIVTLVNAEEKKILFFCTSFLSSLHLSSHPCHVRAIEDATFRNQWCQIGAYHGSVKTQHCFFFGCIHLLQVANFYVSCPFQSLVVKKWRHSQLYLEKFKISTLIR